MHTAPRLYVPDGLAAGSTLLATDAQAHHLGTVLRCVPGDPVRLFNGRDGEWLARIASLRRGTLTLVADRPLRPQHPEPALVLLFALLKRDATDLVVQKATELGVAALHPVLTDRTNAGRTNLDRLAAIATEAAEQSERLTVPVLHPPMRLLPLLAAWPDDSPLYAAVERCDSPPPPRAAGPAGLLVGPEGGFSRPELEAALRYPFVTQVSLGSRVLRAETACIAGLALLQAPRCG